MLWGEDSDKAAFQVPDDVVDLLFRIDCRELPVDHLYALSTGLLALLPWLESDPVAGLHEIFLAGSQNGWQRPDPRLGQKLRLSQRTRLALRVPKQRCDEARAQLSGAELDVGGHRLRIGDARLRPISALDTIFTRHLVLESGEADDEQAFLERVAGQLAADGITLRKALCGRTAVIETADTPIVTRSLLLAELSPEASVRLQQYGIGPLRHMGCGLFLPHKGIAPIASLKDD